MTATLPPDVSAALSTDTRPTPRRRRRTVVALPPVDPIAAARWRAVGWGSATVLVVALTLSMALTQYLSMPLSGLIVGVVGLTVPGPVGLWCMWRADRLSGPVGRQGAGGVG